jgi:membrane fusion protein, adhesin transport system
MFALRKSTGLDSHLGGDALSLPLDIEDNRPLRLFNAVLVWVSAVFVFLILIACFAPIRELANAPGQVMPDGQLVPIQHLEGGIIAEVLVKAGAMVEEGTPLIRLEPVSASSDLGQMQVRRAALELRRLRLQASIEGKHPDFGAFETTYAAMVAEQRHTFESDRATFENNRDALQARVMQREADYLSQKQQAESLDEQIKLQNEQTELKKQLMKLGYAPKSAVLDAQSSLEQLRSRRAATEGLYRASTEAYNESKSLLAQHISNFKRERGEELTKVLGEIGELNEGINKQTDKLDRVFVRASTKGYVFDVLPRNRGEVIKPGDTVAKIVPSDVALIAEVRLQPEDIGHIRIGQVARLTVTTFDTEVFGEVIGTVQWISNSTYETQKGELYYKAIVHLDKESVAHHSDVRPLAPGMVVQARIITGTKSLMRYMLKPIVRSVDGAFSER